MHKFILLIDECVNDFQFISSSFGNIYDEYIGTSAANTVAYGLKKAFAPLFLPATKGDVDSLRKEIENLKFLLGLKKG